MTEFSDWVARVAKRQGMDTEAEISRAVGISQSIVGRWRTHGAIPNIDSLRKIASGLNVSVQEAVVAAGILHPDEVGQIVRVQTALSEVPHEELLAELGRRLDQQLAPPGSTLAMRSSGSADPTESEWHPPK